MCNVFMGINHIVMLRFVLRVDTCTYGVGLSPDESACTLCALSDDNASAEFMAHVFSLVSSMYYLFFVGL